MDKDVEIPLPRCPKCANPLPGVSLYNWSFNEWVILSVFCPHEPCRILLHTQIVPARAMTAVEGPEPSRIHTPN